MLVYLEDIYRNAYLCPRFQSEKHYSSSHLCQTQAFPKECSGEKSLLTGKPG